MSEVAYEQLEILHKSIEKFKDDLFWQTKSCQNSTSPADVYKDIIILTNHLWHYLFCVTPTVHPYTQQKKLTQPEEHPYILKDQKGETDKLTAH